MTGLEDGALLSIRRMLLSDFFAVLFRIEIISLPERLRSLEKRDHARRAQRGLPLQGQACAKS
jgi:hypothetical protein